MNSKKEAPTKQWDFHLKKKEKNEDNCGSGGEKEESINWARLQERKQKWNWKGKKSAGKKKRM